VKSDLNSKGKPAVTTTLYPVAHGLLYLTASQDDYGLYDSHYTVND
jgi:hypothetical protein